jgi:hypothetical protein
MGFFYRTIRMVENGIKPVYVFDGKPPELKSGVVSAVCSDYCSILAVTRVRLVGQTLRKT